MLHDFRLALRMLRRSPGFSILAILCLTLGIGATTSVFGWIEGILLRPFPLVQDQQRLVAVAGFYQGSRDDVSWPDFQDLKKNCRLLETFIGDRIFRATLSIGDRAEIATGSVVSANYFDALGVRPVLGRGFEAADEVGRNAHPVVVIAYQTWQDRYHGDPNIIGRIQMLNGVKHTIVGVAPEGFYGTFVGYSFQFWVPASMESLFTGGDYKLEDRGAPWVEGFARLKPEVTIEQAQAEVSAVARRLENEYPNTNRGREFKLYPLWATPFNNAGTLLPTLRVSMVVAAFVLLIACANVGNLLLVRSFARRQEMAIRSSLGAGAGRLLKQLLIEGLVLSSIAVAGGFLVAYWCRNLIVLLRPTAPGVAVKLPAEIDWRVLALSTAVCLFAAVFMGLIPALQARRMDLAGALKTESVGVIGGGRAHLRSLFVLVQVALSFVLLVGTALLVRSVQQIRNTSPGFATGNLVATSLDFVSAGYDAPRILNFEDELVDRLRGVSGVQSVAFSRVRPFTYIGYSSAPIAVDGYDNPPGERPAVEFNEVGPGYLAALGIPLVSGREFTRADNETGPPVTVVNEAMVAQYWRGRDPVGERLQVNGRRLRVVGVAKLSKYQNMVEAAKPFFYVPLRQSRSGATLFVRAALAPDSVARLLAREIHALDANLSPGEVITMREQVDRMSWAQRAAMTLLTIFGALALVLAAVGLYGVISYTVSQSTRELGLRMALGAQAADLLRLVMSRGVVLTLAGVLLGAVAALSLTRLLGDLLYGTSPRDPLAFGAAFLVMTAAALAACFLPAWKAARIDPLRALRD